MSSLQTQTAIDTLSELYGEPSWLTAPKKGQDLDKVFAEWDEALKKYSEAQVVTACRKIYKYRKTATCPRLAHILAELVDIEPEEEPIATGGGYWQDLGDFRADCVTNGFNGHLCLSSDVDEAMRRVMDEINSEYPPEKHWETRSASDLIGLALRNGVFWDKLDAHLRHIVEMRVSYSASGVVGELFDLPKTFKSTEERKCA